MALYRKYRPATFAEVVGQEQVTAPLSAALDNGRINHAYLFSGPRGCGKTSSARILARSLNCEQGPTSTPCGKCPSCIALAPGGPGNLDVTELDAASHNSVEDMRDLRERAYYAPADSRYRIFIIDEAHMVTNQGFNALLKIVEEPPEHLIFIFATTEPDKVIGTIRSRTHHYPFRLLTPPAMRGLLERTVASEGIHVDDAVYPMVISAGGGSPRDTLSILDQLLAGSGPDGLTYDIARPLLGVTDLTLLDDTIAALASGDKASLFKQVDSVIEAGHEPRRFAIDLLDRLRDLMILQAVPDALEAGLVDASAGRGDVLQAQAKQFSGAQLAHFAATVNDQIGALRGATSPRLLLEILCARLVLDPVATGVPSPAADIPAGSAGKPQSSATTAASSGLSGADAARQAAAEIAARRNAKKSQPTSAPTTAAATPAQPSPQIDERVAVREESAAEQASASNEAAVTSAPALAPSEHEAAHRTVEATPAKEPAATVPIVETAPAAGADALERLRRQWSEVRRSIAQRNKNAGIMLTEARVLGEKDGTIVLGHTTGALAQRLNVDPNNADIVAVITDMLGATFKVHCVVGTDPKVAGFSPAPSPKPVWNPHEEAQEAPAPSPTAEPHNSQEPDTAAPQPSPQSSVQAPAQVASSSDSGWGTPRPLGGQSEQSTREMPQPAPVQKASVGSEGRPSAGNSAAAPAGREAGSTDWRDKIAQAQQLTQQREQEQRNSGTFSNGVPLPPEPGPEEYPEEDGGPYDYAPAGSAPTHTPRNEENAAGNSTALSDSSVPSAPLTQEDEEREMIEAAQQQGERDHRSATEVAMDLLASELGARRL